jgi:hypothetical protein
VSAGTSFHGRSRPNGLPIEALMAHVLVDKYADRLPL